MTSWWELHVCEGCGGKERLGHAYGLFLLRECNPPPVCFDAIFSDDSPVMGPNSPKNCLPAGYASGLGSPSGLCFP